MTTENSASSAAQKKSNAKKYAVGGVGVALGAALLIPGSLALWQAQDDVDGKQITSGNLEIATLSTAAQDISSDRADSPHTIDPATWRAVPGDVVQYTSDIDVALEGDNLVAQLDTTKADAIVSDDAKQYVSTKTILSLPDGTEVPKDAQGNYTLQAPREGQDAGKAVDGVTTVGSTLDGTADVKAVTTITFSADTPDRVLTQTNLTSAENGVATLTQVR